MTHNPYAPPTAPVEDATSAPAGSTLLSGPVGLGGWLTLVGLGLVMTIVKIMLHVGQTYVPLFGEGSWQVLTTPGTEAYHPMWMPLIVFEILGNVGFMLFCGYLLSLFFRRSRWFPGRYIGFLVANLVFILVDAWLVTLVLPDQPMLDPETTTELGRTVVASAIWIPYMLRSVRVKNTFVA